LKELKKEASMVKLLGSYERGNIIGK